MFSLSHFFIGLIVAALGTAAIKYNFQLVNMTGSQDWIESKLGGGSTYFVYKIFGLLAIVCGLLYATGLATPFFDWLLSPFAGIFSPLGSNK